MKKKKCILLEDDVILASKALFQVLQHRLHSWGGDRESFVKTSSTVPVIVACSTGLLGFDLKQIATLTLSTVSYTEKCAL